MTSQTFLASALFALMLTATVPAQAGVGDLLVAPTRIILDGSRGTEIILKNEGNEVATYRISVELRRMKADGTFEDVAQPSEREITARDMIVYAPRRVTLPPKQPQSIRLSARVPQGLPDGEYRVHLLFRAVPPPRPAVQTPADFKGIGFALTPIYGVTIPVIVRLGNLEATAGIAGVALTKEQGKPAVTMQLSRAGSRSTYGEIRITRPGVAEPLAAQKGIAVYTELNARSVTVPIDDKFANAAAGPVRVEYIETTDGISRTLAETQAVLR